MDAGGGIRDLLFFERPVVEASYGHGDLREPMGTREIFFGPRLLQFAHADQGVLLGNLEGQVILRMVAKAVETGVPALARTYAEIAAALLGDHAVAEQRALFAFIF